MYKKYKDMGKVLDVTKVTAACENPWNLRLDGQGLHREEKRSRRL